MYSFQQTLNDIHKAAKFTKFGAIGDRFVATFSGTFNSGNPGINANGFQQVIYRGTQFDSTNVQLEWIAVDRGMPAYENVYQFSITFDDVFSGRDATLQTVQDQFMAVMNQYFDNIHSTMSNAQVYPVRNSGGNSGGNVVNNPPPVGNQLIPPPSPGSNPGQHSTIYNTFFNSRGELTGVGIGVIAVGSIALLTLVIRNNG